MAPPADHDARLADDPAPLLLARFPDGADLGDELLALLATPTIADKSWVWRQYDHQLFLNTVVGPGGDATVLRLKGTSRALALSTDGKARFCRLDPRTGGRLVVLEAARNVACAGAEPRALVNCLNFGNPEHPEVMWQFSEVVDGMSEACRALGIPVIGGNVSFYNESQGRDIDPTPVVGVDRAHRLARPSAARGPARTRASRRRRSARTAVELAGSEWAAVVHGLGDGAPPVADLDLAARAARARARPRRERGVVGAVHDAVRRRPRGRARRDGDRRRVRVRGRARARHPGRGMVLRASRRRASWSRSTPERLDEVLTRAADAGVAARDVGMTGRRPSRRRRRARRRARRRRAARWRDAIPTLVGADVPIAG